MVCGWQNFSRSMGSLFAGIAFLPSIAIVFAVALLTASLKYSTPSQVLFALMTVYFILVFYYLNSGRL